MKFANAVACGATETTNGMPALKNSGNSLVNFFFGVGAARNNPNKAISDFIAAFNEDKLLATKILFWARDVRGGAGERQIFRTLLNALEQSNADIVIKNMHLIPVVGRWDDLLSFTTPTVIRAAYQLISDTLLNQRDGWQLCSKWIPRKGNDAIALRAFMNLSPKAYRKMLVNGTQVVETAMCAKDWTNINYEHVPSVAAKIYQKAFNRHDENGYGAYKEKLTSGEAKINASAIFPHDVIRGSDPVVADAQWKALPNYLVGDTAILPMIDVSGSMLCGVGGNNSGLTCMDVSVSLGLYIADKQSGPFGGLYLTFTDKPTLTKIPSKSGRIHDRFAKIKKTNVGYNTNIQAAYKEILRVAKTNNVAPKDMPKMLIIFSDMQFDQAMAQGQVNGYNPTAQQMARDMFSQSGYELPKIVYWNLKAHDNVPVAFDEEGTALVSGFSPAILTALLSGKEFTPYGIMMEAISSPRYNDVSV